jgi:type I restriction enzyme S subunit
MNNYKLGDLIKIHNGTKYSHLEIGNIPLYGSGGIMSYVNDFLYDGEAILLPRKGTLTNIMYTNGKIWTVDTMYYATTNEKVNPYYLYCYLSILDLEHLDSGSALPSMTKSVYEDLEIKLPALPTQKAIAKVLSDLDAKIELNNRINRELEAMAKTLYDY